jgi:hypothetical protein
VAENGLCQVRRLRCKASTLPLCTVLIEGSLEVKLRTIWTDGKAEVGRVREENRKEDQRRERDRRKKMQVREKVEKSQITVYFQ